MVKVWGGEALPSFLKIQTQVKDEKKPLRFFNLLAKFRKRVKGWEAPAQREQTAAMGEATEELPGPIIQAVTMKN